MSNARPDGTLPHDWFTRIIESVIRYRWWWVGVLLVATAAGAASTALNLRVNNAVSIWFLEDNPDYQSYLDFQHERGSDEIIIAMLPAARALDTASLTLLDRLHRQLDSLPDVTATFSLANARYPIYSNGKLYYRPIFPSDRDPRQVERLLGELPALRRQLLDAAGRHVFFYVQLEPTDVIEARRNQIVTQVENTIRRTAPGARLAGQPILNEAFNATIYRESSFFAVATVAVILLLLLFLLPHRRYVPLALAAVIVPISILMGIMTALGYSLNLISMLIPTILMVYSVGDTVHVVNIFHQYANERPELRREEQIKTALRRSLKPCFYTTLTTVIGYLALYFSPLPAFRVMGLFTFFGMVLAFVLVYLITAIGFSFVGEVTTTKRARRLNIQRITDRVSRWTTQYPRRILGLAGLAAVAGLCLLPRLIVNTDSLHLLDDGPVKTDLLAIEDALGGNARVQINVVRRDGGSLFNAADLDRLAAFQSDLTEIEELAHPVSIVNFRDFLAARSTSLAAFSGVNPTEVLRDQTAPPNAFFRLSSTDGSELNIAAGLRELESRRLERLLADVDDRFQRHFPSDEYALEVHGFLALFAQLNRFILQTQFRSFGLAFVVAFGILVYFIGDLKTSFLALLPNLLPLLLTIIVMVLGGIALEAANAMLAPIMLGVAMDDTIHLMNKYRLRRAAGDSVQQAVDTALTYTGGALFATTLALVCGFLVVGMSGVVSVSTFGLLCAFTVLAALVADAVVLPALLKWGLAKEI